MQIDTDWRIRFNAPRVAGSEIDYIKRVAKYGRLAGDGEYTRRCHSWLEDNLSCKNVLLTQSGTAALEMAALLCNIGPGDEVIMPSFTFVSTANAFVLRGATPVFVDIDPTTLNIDTNLILGAITSKTKAIIPVHYGGIPCDMDGINRLANAHNLRVIEDAAHALLASHNRQFLGTFGDLGCISFHETKNIVSGEGGALLINDRELLDRARVIWQKGTNRDAFNLGLTDKYTWVDQGSSFLPSELTAAFLLAQLEESSQIIKHRLKLRSTYRKILQPLSDSACIRLPAENKQGKENGHLFYLITNSSSQRDDLIRHLATAKIMATFHYVPLHSSPAGERYGRHVGRMEVTNTISERLLRLPLHGNMSIDDAAYVAATVLDFFDNNP